MYQTTLDSHIHYKHSSQEVAALNRALIPMAEHVAAVAKSDEKYKLKLVTTGKYFRVREARAVRNMLLRACKHARAHLGDYFPMMQAGILQQTQELEDATNAYWVTFEQLREETLPVH